MKRIGLMRWVLCFGLMGCFAVSCKQVEERVGARDQLIRNRQAAAAYEAALEPLDAAQDDWVQAMNGLPSMRTVGEIKAYLQGRLIPSLTTYERALSQISCGAELQPVHDALCAAHRLLLQAYEAFGRDVTAQNSAEKSQQLRIAYETFRAAQTDYRERLRALYSSWGVTLRSTRHDTTIEPASVGAR